MTFNIFNLIIEKYGLKYIERKKEVKETNRSFLEEENKSKILNLLNIMKEYYETIMRDNNRKIACELVIEYIEKPEQNRSNRNEDLPPIKPPSPTKSSSPTKSAVKTPQRVTQKENESLKVDTSEEMMTPVRDITENRKKSIFTPPKKLEKPLDENFHRICRFYSGNEEYEGRLISEYLTMNSCKLIRKVIRNLHFFFPLIGEVIDGNEFKEKDKYIFVSTLVIRQNFNRFMDFILVCLGIRSMEDDNSMKWIFDDIYPSYELKKIVKRMKDCLLQLFDKWVVYIENLNTIIKDNNIENEVKDENNEEEEENDEDSEIVWNNSLNQTIEMKSSVYYDRLHPVYIIIIIYRYWHFILVQLLMINIY